MIVKGHDFANVTLVGIIAADLSLNSGDYRAAEKTFQLTTQACGRAGRADKPGEVVIQTYQPEHYSIVYAAKNGPKNFYEQETVTEGQENVAISADFKYTRECWCFQKMKEIRIIWHRYSPIR